MVISKLGTNRPKDLDDIYQSGLLNKIDKSYLSKLIKERLYTPMNVERMLNDLGYLSNLEKAE